MGTRAPLILCLLAIPATWLVGCAKSFQGAYADPKTLEIVDDRWNETDARKTSEILIQSMLKKPWLNTFGRTHGQKQPVVLVEHITNRTEEHIDTKSLSESIRDELINSGQIRFVNADAREKMIGELKFQNESGMVSPETAKQIGRQVGADFMLGGAISSNVHEQEGLKTVTYQTNLILTNLETAEIVWSEKYLIKKRFNRSSMGW